MFKMKTIQIILLIALACTSFQPMAAGTSIKQMNTTIIADFNQNIDKDIRGLVDTDRLEIEFGPYYNVIWSPDEKHALINVKLYVCPKGKGDTQSGYISALYIAGKDFSNISRIAWTEFTTTEYGKIIESPSWSHSGDYFAYEELTEGKMYTVKSAQLFVVSTEMQQVQQIEMDNKMLRNYNYPLNYKWSPVEEMLAVPAPGKLVIYDPVKENNLTFDIDNDISNIDHLEWSPNGKNIAFLEGYKDIVNIDIDQKERYLMYSVENIGMYDTVWSPDSQKLVFYTLNETDENSENGYDIYVMDKNTNTTEKINQKRGIYSVLNWYPDSERLLVADLVADDSIGSSKLCSISITGNQKVLLDGIEVVEVHLGPDDYISVLDTSTSKLVIFNDSYKQDFSNVTASSWINNDLMFTTNSKTSILDTGTNTIWEIPRSAIYPYMISISPQEHFIAINNTILKINYGNSPGTITRDQNNDSASQVTVLNSSNNQEQKVNTTAASKAPGFSAILGFIGFVVAMAYVHIKKQ